MTTPVRRAVAPWAAALLLAAALAAGALWVEARRRGAELERTRARAGELEALVADAGRRAEPAGELARLSQRLAQLEPFAPFLATAFFRGELPRAEGLVGARYRLRFEAVTPTPDPRTSPYADCLVVLEARVLAAAPRSSGEPPDPNLAEGERVLVTTWGFQARKASVAARLSTGDVAWCTLLAPSAVDGSVQEIQVVDATDALELPAYLGCALALDGASPQRPAPVVDALVPPGTARAATIALVGERVLAELRAHGGSFEAWFEGLAPFRAAVERLRAQAETSDVLKACDGLRLRGASGPWFEGYSSALLRGPSASPSAVALVAGLSRQLEQHGIDLVYVPVNLKSAVYPERILFDHRAVIPEDGIVDPQWRRYMAELCQAGVEVVDLFPFLMAEKRAGARPLYLFDHHWAPRTIEIAADLVAARLRRHFPESAGDGAPYRLERGELEVEGEALEAYAVFSARDGRSYADSNLLVGSGALDGIRSSVAGGNASFSAHLAERLGFPVASGGRYLVEEGERLARARSGFFAGRKAVVLVSGMTRSAQDGPLPEEPIVLPARLFE
jgi:hypothetical protein